MKNVKLASRTTDDQIVTKNVSAIHIGARLSLTQRKLVNALLYHAYDTLLIEDTHTIPIPLLMEIIGFDSRNQNHLKKAIRGLTETSIEWDMMADGGTSVWEVATLLSYARIQNGKCTYRYDKSLAEKLHDPSVFAKINLSVVRDIRSAHTLALYENCFRYIGIGKTPKWDIDVFRKLLAVDGLSSYQQFKILKRDLISPAMKEINQLSNIKVELKTEKKGRTITSVQFLVKKNPQMALMGIEEEDDVSASALYKPLLEEGYNKALVRGWILEYGEDYLQEKMTLVKRLDSEGRIKSSRAGFLKAAIEQNYHDEGKAQEKRQKDAQRVVKARRLREAQISERQQELRRVETAYRWACGDQMTSALAGLVEDKARQVLEEFRARLHSSVTISGYEKNGWKDPLVFREAVSFWTDRGLDFPSPSAWARDNGFESPDRLKAEIEELKNTLTE